MPEDRWAHRSQEMRCRSCMYFVPKSVSAVMVAEREWTPPQVGQAVPSIPAASTDITVVPSPLGRCRRHAPTLGGWPAVFQDDWCGDHKLDENKL